MYGPQPICSPGVEVSTIGKVHIEAFLKLLHKETEDFVFYDCMTHEACRLTLEEVQTHSAAMLEWVLSFVNLHR